MPKFRKKPVVIEAEKFDADEIRVKHVEGVYQDATSSTGFSIDTLEGNHEVTPGDWIITGVKGERYPCKPDIFKMTYESVAVPDPHVKAKTADEYTRKMELLKRVENDFVYHAPKGDQINRYAEIRDLGKQLAILIVNLTPISREQSLALTLLEQATMMANAAIARNE